MSANPAVLALLAERAPAKADRTLVLSLTILAVLIVGAVLAAKRRYALHQWCQTVAVALNLALVVQLMLNSYDEAVRPRLAGHLTERFFLVTTIHAVLGVITLAMGLFMVLRGNDLVPRRLRFTNYRPWMRATLALYVAQTMLGVWVYWLFYAT